MSLDSAPLPRWLHGTGALSFGGIMPLQHIYEYIDQYWQENGYAPSVREIGEHVGLAPSAVSRYLEILAARGAIEWQPKVPRTVRIIGALH